MRAVIYARYSSELQSNTSINDQVRLCTGFIERQGWACGRSYSDQAISGASLLRPGYQKLLEDARAQNFDVLVAEGLDRLSRDQADVANLFKHLAWHPDRHCGRGSDQRAACRAEGHDECALPEGPGH